MEFEWDDQKAAANFKKHGVRFAEAVTVWQDQNSIEIPDSLHSESEERWIRLGLSRKANLLVVVYCERIEGERIRIISARAATKIESNQYQSR